MGTVSIGMKMIRRAQSRRPSPVKKMDSLNFDKVPDEREMDECEQYFGFLFSTWREEKEKDMTRTVGEVQD